MLHHCPTCKQPIERAPDEIREIFRRLDLPRRERQAMRALLDAWPKPVRPSALVVAIYDDVNDEPAYPESCMQSHISKLRKKLNRCGWTISSQRHLGYRLEALAAQRPAPAGRSGVSAAT